MAESILGPIDVNLNSTSTGKLFPLNNFPLLPIPYSSRATKGYASGLNYKFIAFNSHRSLQASELNEIQEHNASAQSLNLRFNANWKNSDYGKVPFWSGIMPLSPDQVIAEQPQVLESNKLLFTFLFKSGWYLVARNNKDGLNRWVYFPKNIDVEFEYINSSPQYTVYLGFNAHHPILKCCSNVANCNDLTQSVTEDNGWPTYSSEFLDNSQDYSEDQNAYTCGGDREFFAIKDDLTTQGTGFFGVSNSFLGDDALLCIFRLTRFNDNYQLIFLDANEIIYDTEFQVQNVQQGNSVGSFFGSVGSFSGATGGEIITSDSSYIKISTLANISFGRARLINEPDPYGIVFASPEPDIFDAKETKTAKYSAEVQVESYDYENAFFNANPLIVGYFTTKTGFQSGNDYTYILPIEKGIVFRPSAAGTWACSFYQKTTTNILFQEYSYFPTSKSIFERASLKIILDNYGKVAKWFIDGLLVNELNIENFSNLDSQNFIYSISDVGVQSNSGGFRTNKCYVGCHVASRSIQFASTPSSLKIFNSVFETKQS